MSKKAKYKAVKDAMNPGTWFVESPRDIICQRCSMSSARKIARALNAMEDKPKAKAWKFDWSGIQMFYKFASMDKDGTWWAFSTKPSCGPASWDNNGVPDLINYPPYPGDWRDSLQERPSK